jgi:hypothetical protein
MRGGWKVNASEYNNFRTEQDKYRMSDKWRAKNNTGIYWVVLTIVLLLIVA